MAHRCRVCGLAHVSEGSAIRFPWPERLAQIDAVMLDLIEAAREFESFGPGTPLEFVEWMAMCARRTPEPRTERPIKIGAA